MIEKIMKAVKSGNKKRGRNITVGTVVGMLLSCTVVMGAGETGLEITNGSSKIEFIDKDGNKSEDNPYPENTWDEVTETYINNITLSGISADHLHGCGIILNGDLGEFKFINNALITGATAEDEESLLGEGIYNKNGTTITELKNNGFITGTSVKSGSYGIFNEDTITTLTNNGSIKGTSTKGKSHGIRIEYGAITTLTNNGTIKGISTEGESYGIDNDESTITTLINKGSIKGISGKGASYGIYTDEGAITTLINSGVIKGISTEGTSYGIDNDESTITTLTNTGIISGGTNAIKNESSGTISNANNYGLLVSSTGDTVSDVTLTKNLGLIFKDVSGTYSAKDGTDFEKFGKAFNSDDKEYRIINVKANGTYDSITGTESLTLKKGTLSYLDSDSNEQNESIFSDKKYVLNGIEDTLKVSGTENELNNSTVNAYKIAVVMDKGMSTLTLDNTVVNGGVAEDSPTVNITGDGSTLTVKGDSVINTEDEGTAITITGDKNAVNLEGNAIVNVKMESNGNNILNLYGKADGSMNMLYDISGFTDISIDNNVTFFEDMKVTGTKEVTVEKTGVLSLRLKKEDTVTYSTGEKSTATHAFSGTDGMIIKGNSPEESGTLNFITNGIGREILVDMENIKLNNMKIRTNSIIDKVDLDTYKDEGYIYLGAG
ncbi:MAG: autotransporter domain-containing protein, partial [Fusobacterium ulcerans]